MTLLKWAAAFALALISSVAASAATPVPQCVNSGGAYMPCQGAMLLDSSAIEKATDANPLSSKAIVQTGSATTLSGTVTASACSLTSTPAGATCAIASGTATAGPFTPQLGRPVRLGLKGGATFTAYVGTSTDNCATVNQLTALGTPITFSGSIDEYVDMPPTTGGVTYCLVATVSAGTLTFAARQ